MAKSNKIGVIGQWAFLIGVVIAVIIGLFGITFSYIPFILLIIGLVVGFLNVSDKEAMPFLMSGVVLVIVSNFGKDSLQITQIQAIFDALMAIFVPATIVVAVKNVFSLARN